MPTTKSQIVHYGRLLRNIDSRGHRIQYELIGFERGSTERRERTPKHDDEACLNQRATCVSFVRRRQRPIKPYMFSFSVEQLGNVSESVKKCMNLPIGREPEKGSLSLIENSVSNGSWCMCGAANHNTKSSIGV